MKWFLPFPLRAPAGDDDGGGESETALLDPGAPHELDHDDPPADPKAKDDPPAKSVADLEAEVAAERGKRERAEEDAQFWAKRASGRREPESERVAEPRPTVQPPAANADNAEDFLTDMTTKGASALKDRGFITKVDMEEAITRTREETRREILSTRNDAEFGLQLEREFPEILADSKRIDQGLAPQTELFKRAGEIYRESLRMDPQLEGSRSALVMAARQAKAELAAGDRGRGDEPPRASRQQERRERVERQMAPKGRSERGREADDTPTLNEETKTVMKHLGVTEEEFDNHREARRGR